MSLNMNVSYAALSSKNISAISQVLMWCDLIISVDVSPAEICCVWCGITRCLLPHVQALPVATATGAVTGAVVGALAALASYAAQTQIIEAMEL